jgi:hypothetical protein
MNLREADPFETDSPGAAARQLRLALGALLGSVVLWLVAILAYWRVAIVDWVPVWLLFAVVAVGLVVEACILLAFVRSVLEYTTWVSRRVDWIDF